MDWAGLAPYIIAILSVQLILSLCLLLVLFKYPIVLYKIWKRYAKLPFYFSPFHSQVGIDVHVVYCTLCFP